MEIRAFDLEDLAEGLIVKAVNLSLLCWGENLRVGAMEDNGLDYLRINLKFLFWRN